MDTHGTVMDEMDNAAARQGLPVAGYQPQSADNIAAVNRNKHIEEAILRDMDILEAKLGRSAGGRWLAIARTQMEQAFMAYNRAIFQPQRITGKISYDMLVDISADHIAG